MARRLKLFGHPVHPMLSDLPIVLCGAAFPCDVAARLLDNPELYRVSFWAIVVGLVASLPTAVAGFVDFSGLPGESKASKVGVWHLSAMFTALCVFGGTLLVRGGATPPVGTIALWATLLDGLGLGLLTVGGWLGGHLVFHYGVGVERAPH